MKLSIFFLCFPFLVFSQTENDSNTFFLNEYNFSTNHSIYNLKQNTFGFGLGAYRTVEVKKHFDLSFGLEYNLSRQIQGYEFSGGHSDSPNGTSAFFISLHAITLPFNVRVNFGTNVKLFVESGVFIETMYHTARKENVIEDPNGSKIVTFSNGQSIKPFNFGGSFGFGISYPINKMEYYIKPELKFGVLNNRYFRICLGIRFR